MRIVIVGGGPGGLFFGILMRRLGSAHEVTVFERHAAQDGSGWGVAFAGSTLEILRNADGPTFDDLHRAATTWNRLDFFHRHERVSARSDPFAGLSRAALLDVLRRRATALDVDLRFRAPVHDVRALPEADLVVGADGANSLVRRALEQGFQPALRAGRNKYVWLGVRHRLDALTLAVQRTPAGVFVAHAYPFDETHSSVIVECGEQAWSRAGFDRRTDIDACAYLSDAFADVLQGHLLLSHDRMHWRNFLLVENARWSHERAVLIGDALHTVHFSTGAGTRVALEDAIALARALSAGDRIDAALADFEAQRRPAAAASQAQARASLEWFEHPDRLMSLAPRDLAYRAITETRRIDPGRLAELEPDLVRGMRPPPGS